MKDFVLKCCDDSVLNLEGKLLLCFVVSGGVGGHRMTQHILMCAYTQPWYP